MRARARRDAAPRPASGTAGWAVARLAELQPGEPRALIRRHFGISAFGVNAWRGANAGDEIIASHDEPIERHEELYLVLGGRATFTLDGREVDAPLGTIVFVKPEVMRGAVAAEAETVVLAVGAEPGEPFSPSPWEDWDVLGISELFKAGRYAEAAERYRGIIDRYGDHAGAHFNLACLLSLAGRTDDALEHLRRSIDLEPGNRRYAREDSDFDPIRADPRFVALTVELGSERDLAES